MEALSGCGDSINVSTPLIAITNESYAHLLANYLTSQQLPSQVADSAKAGEYIIVLADGRDISRVEIQKVRVRATHAHFRLRISHRIVDMDRRCGRHDKPKTDLVEGPEDH